MDKTLERPPALNRTTGNHRLVAEVKRLQRQNQELKRRIAALEAEKGIRQ